MSNGYPFFLQNGEKMSNKVGVVRTNQKTPPKFNSSPLKAMMVVSRRSGFLLGNFSGAFAVKLREGTLPPIIMVQRKMGVSPITSLPFKCSHFTLPWKLMVGIRYFPVGFWPIFKCYVSFREGNYTMVLIQWWESQESLLDLSPFLNFPDYLHMKINGWKFQKGEVWFRWFSGFQL